MQTWMWIALAWVFAGGLVYEGTPKREHEWLMAAVLGPVVLPFLVGGWVALLMMAALDRARGGKGA